MAVVLMLSFSYLYIVIIHINSYFRLICLLLSSFVTSGALGVPSYFSFNFTWLDPLLSETGKQVFFRTSKVWTLVQHGSGRGSKQDRKRFLKLHKWASVAHEVLSFFFWTVSFCFVTSHCNLISKDVTFVYSKFRMSGPWISLLSCFVTCLSIQTGPWVKLPLIHTPRLWRNFMAGLPVLVLR